MVDAFPSTGKFVGGSPAKLVDGSMVNIAPTNLLIYISYVFILFETVAVHCAVSTGKKRSRRNITYMGLKLHISFSVM